MPSDLFRNEVLEAKRAGWLGSISLVQPTKLWVLAISAAMLALVVVLLLVFGKYTRRSHVGGQLVPVNGMAIVVAPTSGFISRIYAAEGDRVQAGQVVAVLTMPRATTTDGDTLAAIESRLGRKVLSLEDARTARRRQFEAKHNGLTDQLANARSELRQIGREISTRKDQIRIAQETVDRLRLLEDDRYVSILQIKQQQSVALTQQSEMQSLQRQAISTRRLIDQIMQALEELPSESQADYANFQRDLASLEQEKVENIARGELAVIAPAAGVVSVQQVKSGQAVQNGQSLMSVLPGDGVLEAELLVPSKAIGFIEPMDKVLLRYQAYPYQKFGHHEGRVSRISRSTFETNQATEAREPMYRITVALKKQTVDAYGNSEQLKPGMLVDADILGESRSFFEWVLEPVYSIRGTVFGR
ncbi:HlyD family efflux transporter periplasmic adaptor subunit [Xanthomonas cassavae CFBP 4642]|uniref:HlyD family efflux transporter periplasmic adaptor subunit n=1 Tax=Xanthomonas cassavae CFBP 4642 TaxID=1219375 RepID=A0ABS8HG78_9XANT|nr:HlyD family efflux transporter periplasmic adaptor subunit [Xanthomonas cassavae]MCC4620739.1 HlyD family efflux transporter periplasmic adaptor subunit [Xanthomonas cassavae CFBP 4642]